MEDRIAGGVVMETAIDSYRILHIKDSVCGDIGLFTMKKHHKTCCHA